MAPWRAEGAKALCIAYDQRELMGGGERNRTGVQGFAGASARPGRFTTSPSRLSRAPRRPSDVAPYEESPEAGAVIGTRARRARRHGQSQTVSLQSTHGQ